MCECVSQYKYSALVRCYTVHFYKISVTTENIFSSNARISSWLMSLYYKRREGGKNVKMSRQEVVKIYVFNTPGNSREMLQGYKETDPYLLFPHMSTDLSFISGKRFYSDFSRG